MRTEPTIKNKDLVVCVSGGKDSTAMALRISRLWRRLGCRSCHYVWCDTGWEHPVTVQHVADLGDHLGVEIHRIVPPLDFVELSVKKRRFPSARRRFCTEFLKVKPLAIWIEDRIDDGTIEDPVLVQGIRADESRSRANMLRWDEYNGGRSAYDCPMWRPILGWSPARVFREHKRRGMSINPLYLNGCRRVGCWPCIMSSKVDLRAAFLYDPDLLNRLRVAEAKVVAASRQGGSSFAPHDKTPKRFHDRTYIRESDGEEFTYASADALYAWCMESVSEADLSADQQAPTCWSHYGLCE